MRSGCWCLLPCRIAIRLQSQNATLPSADGLTGGFRLPRLLPEALARHLFFDGANFSLAQSEPLPLCRFDDFSHGTHVPCRVCYIVPGEVSVVFGRSSPWEGGPLDVSCEFEVGTVPIYERGLSPLWRGTVPQKRGAIHPEEIRRLLFCMRRK